MPDFKMTYPYARDFQELGRVEPDEVITADENPDGNFFEAVGGNGNTPPPLPPPAPVEATDDEATDTKEGS